MAAMMTCTSRVRSPTSPAWATAGTQLPCGSSYLSGKPNSELWGEWDLWVTSLWEFLTHEPLGYLVENAPPGGGVYSEPPHLLANM